MTTLLKLFIVPYTLCYYFGALFGGCDMPTPGEMKTLLKGGYIN